MKKKKIKIISLTHLSNEHFEIIREYRNQLYIRKVSVNSDPISKEDHLAYKIKLLQKNSHFGFLIQNNETDYGVINLRKINNNTYNIGDYLVKEEYKYEGGGIVNRFCISYIATKLGIKYLKGKQLSTNTRGSRGGGVITLQHINSENGFDEYLAEAVDFYDENYLTLKARKVFDKLYDIIEFKP